METIIFSNSNRQASYYQADKICLADRVDIPHLLHTEMQQCNIQHLHLWFVSSNLDNLPNSSTQQILLTLGKHCLQQHGQFVLEFLLEKYTHNSMKHTLPHSLFNRHSQQTDTFSFRDSQDKGNSLLSRDSLQRSELDRQRVKFCSFKEFQLFIFKEQCFFNDQQTIRTYIFKGKSEIIKVSLIAQNQKDLLRRIVDQNNDMILDAKIRHKKRYTLTSQHISSANGSSILPTVHNKLILYLFTQQPQTTSKNRLRTYHSCLKNNFAMDALEEWRIKEDSVDQVAKLEKDYQLIRQQIQNQRLIFRQKIKCLQSTLGETINADKLLHEEEDQCYLNTNVHKMDKRGSFCRKERHSKITSHSSGKLALQTSEFKRLKDVSDAIKGIENILGEQSKKIEQYKSKLKQLVIEKDKVNYSQSKTMNHLRTQIQFLKQEIKRKQMEIQEKNKNGYFQKSINCKSRQPTSEAQSVINQYSRFFNKLEQKKNENNNGTFRQAGFPTLDVSNSTSRIVHKSLHHTEKLNHGKILLMKQREMKLREVQNTKEYELEKHELEKKFLKKVYKKQYSLTPFEQAKQDQLEQNNILNTQLLEQLVELYKYYKNNQKVIAMARKDIKQYHLFNSKDDLNIKEQSEIQQGDFPLLFSYLKRQKSNQNPQLLQKVNTFQKDEVVKVHKDCFEWAINKQRKQPVPHPIIPQKTTSGSGCPSVPSVDSELIDQILENTQLKEIVPKKTSFFKASPRFKRMTIEQTISLSNNLRFSSFQKNYK